MGKKVTISIDGKQVTAEAGEKLLWVALENDIYIPHLCAMKEHDTPFGACRLCFVEVEGKPRPVTACTEPIEDGMVVKTRSEQIDRLVQRGFELILSNHHVDCKHCPGNGSCELQKIAKERKWPLKPKHLPRIQQELPVDQSMDGIIYDPNKCVLCGKCVVACREEGAGILGFGQRGFERRVTTFNDLPLADAGCTGCGACARACPVGARAETN